MGPWTQPQTDAERAYVRERMKEWGFEALDSYQSSGPTDTVLANAAPDPVEFDWLALNREFSE